VSGIIIVMVRPRSPHIGQLVQHALEERFICSVQRLPTVFS